MTADERALIQAIIASPADDLPRLVYADWLEEHGRPERAEFIRMQIWLSQTKKTSGSEAQRREWSKRLRILLRQFMDRWRREIHRDQRARWGAFERGFVQGATLDLRGSSDFEWIEELFTLTPLANIGCRYGTCQELDAALRVITSHGVRVIWLYPAHWWGPELVIRRSEDTRLLLDFRWPRTVQLLGIQVYLWERDQQFVDLLTDVPSDRYLPVLDLRKSWGLSSDSRLRLTSRFGDRVLL